MESGCTHSDVSLHSSLSVLKYRKNDEDESLKDKLSKLNIHSISKKSKRVTNHLKILTRGESQVIFLLGPPTFPRGSLPVVGALALLFLWPCLKHRIKVVPQALPCTVGGGVGGDGGGFSTTSVSTGKAEREENAGQMMTKPQETWSQRLTISLSSRPRLPPSQFYFCCKVFLCLWDSLYFI